MSLENLEKQVEDLKKEDPQNMDITQLNELIERISSIINKSEEHLNNEINEINEKNGK